MCSSLGGGDCKKIRRNGRFIRGRGAAESADNRRDPGQHCSSTQLIVWSCGPTNGNDEIRHRCARRVVPTCLRRHTLLSAHKKTTQRFSNFGQRSQNANSLLKRLLGPRAVHVSVSKEESTRSLRNVCRFRLEQQASCTFACCLLCNAEQTHQFWTHLPSTVS
jgi:hypothetical protein